MNESATGSQDMTRLERFIARMQAQKNLLDRVADDLNRPEAVRGPVIELGLGNGRTFDHMRAKFVDRRILVFERDPRPNEQSWPLSENLLVGEIEETARLFAAKHPHSAALVHADLGDGTKSGNERLEQWLPALCHALAVDNGWVLSSTRLAHEGLVMVPAGADFAGSPYNAYRVST